MNTPIALTDNGIWQTASSQIIVNGSISGGFGINRNAGVGGLTLNGANTFSGGLTSSQGTVYLGHDQAAGTGTIGFGAASSPIWTAINGNRTIPNPMVTASINTAIGPTFAGADFRFTHPLGLQITSGTAGGNIGEYKITINNGRTTFDGGFTNTATLATQSIGITKEGPGTLVFNGNSGFDGDSGLTDAVKVNAGALLFNGTVTTRTGTGQKSYQINSGGTFGGSGTITLRSVPPSM